MQHLQTNVQGNMSSALAVSIAFLKETLQKEFSST